MDNKKIENISKKSFDAQKDDIVNLRAKIGVSREEEDNEFLNKQTENTQKSESEENPMESLENVIKNISQQNTFKNDNDEVGNKRKDIKSNYFLRYFLYFLAFLLPLFLLPFSVEIFEFNKTFLLFTVSSLAFLIWIAKMIVIDRRLVFVRTPLNIPIIIFVFLVLLSTALSVDKVSSVLGFYGRFSDSLMVYLSLAMLYFVGVNSMIKTVETRQCLVSTMTMNLIKAFLASSFIVVVAGLLYSFGFKFIPWTETQFRSFNLIAGSLNVLGIYLVAVIMIAFYYLLEAKNALVKYSVYLLIAATLILLAVIDFVLAWIVLVISLSVSLVLMLMAQRRRSGISTDGKNIVETRQCLVPTGLVILISLTFVATSLTFINKDIRSNFESSLISSLIRNRIMPPADNGQTGNDGNGFAREIILDKKTAISIAAGGIKEDPISGIIGTGPGTYLYNFSKFKPVEFNNSIFWSVRFDKAGSEIIEKISTIGILGTLSYLLIIVLTIGMFLKTSFRNVGTRQCLVSTAYLFSAWLSLLLFQFLYLESTTIKFVFWMLTIMLAARYVASRFHSLKGTMEPTKNIFWEFKIGKSNYIPFLSLLLVITALITASYYYQIRFYQAEAAYKNVIFAYDKAIKDTSLTRQDAWGVLDESVENLKKVIEKNPYNGVYKFYLSDIYFNRLIIVLQEENERNNEERNNQMIMQEMKSVIDYAKGAADEDSNNIIFQHRLGNIYAYMFSNIKIADADEWAIKKYNRAISLEPFNPILYTELGKVYVLQYSESKDEDKINSAIGEFEKALELKNNYKDAGLQLGLAYEIKGDNEKAINQLNSFLENGTADINIAFQLGRIYYNFGNISEAKNIFLEITKLQPRNSNARYSLGLIYEKEENYEEALKEFEAVLFLNPDNQEVTEKIDNLKEMIEKKNRKPEPIPEPATEEENVEDEMGEEIEFETEEE